MISTVINCLRAFKAAHDVAFSDKPDAAETRAELRNGIGYSVQQFKAGYLSPQPTPVHSTRIRKPFKVALYILSAILLITIMFAGRQ